MFRLIWTAVLAAAATGVAGGVRAEAPQFEPGACVGDFKGVPNKVDCGALVVDEARGGPSKRRIRIPVAIVRATTPIAGLPPVVYLHGGPGGDVIENVPNILKSPAAGELFGTDQDWIFIDQRGSGLGQPGMDCPGTELTDAGPPTQKHADAIVACLQRFRAQGVDLSRYNAFEVAHDVQDLRRALNLKQIDLFGGSYGTRIEAAVLRHAPQGVRAVVQDSPWPPEGNWAVGTPEQVSAAVRLILQKCATQAECGRRYRNLAARFAQTARRWMGSPQTANGVTYTADDLGSLLMDSTYSRQGVARLPMNLQKIVDGDLSPVAAAVEDRGYYHEGQHMAHLCKEEIPFENKAAVARGALGDPVAQLLVAPLSRLFDMCARLDVGGRRRSEQEPVKTSVPTLFLAAEIDPGCPPHLTRAAAKGYRGSQVVIVTNGTHGVTGNNRCARNMARAFFRDPTKAVDRSCLPKVGQPFPFLYAETKP